MHIYVSVNWVIIGSGKSHMWHQAIISTKDDLLSAGHLGTNFGGI